MTEGETPPAAPDPPLVLESLLLSVAHYWSRREPPDRVVELLERHFRQDEMLAALRELAELLKRTAPHRRLPTAARTATKGQAQDVFDTLLQLGDEDKLPRFTVQSDDLGRVQPLLGAVSVGDERGVSARLEELEASHRRGMVEMKRGMDEMKQLVTNMGRSAMVPSAALPAIEVTRAPSFAEAAGTGVGAGRAPAGANQGPAGEQPFFNRGRPDVRLQVVEQGRRQGQGRSTSAEKRRRITEQGGYQEQRNYASAGRKQRARPRPAVIKGTSSEFPDLATPVTFWVGKCRPDLNEKKVEEVILKNAESFNLVGFAIENVKCLTKDPNPWTKSFKVSVPARFEEAMTDPKMYLPSWEARAFTEWPSRQPQGPPAPRQDGSAAPRQEGPARDGQPASQTGGQEGLVLAEGAAPAVTGENPSQ
jgi:hypothetical protein